MVNKRFVPIVMRIVIPDRWREMCSSDCLTTVLPWFTYFNDRFVVDVYISDEGDRLEDGRGNTDLRNFDNALYFSGLPVESTHDDEVLRYNTVHWQ